MRWKSDVGNGRVKAELGELAKALALARNK
jgi:hypothetical protein